MSDTGNAIADQFLRQAEAKALTFEDAIKANEARKEYITRALADVGVEVCRQLDDANAMLARMAQAERAGTAILPPASTLSEAVVNVEAVVDPPKLAGSTFKMPPIGTFPENLPPPTEEETELHREAA